MVSKTEWKLLQKLFAAVITVDMTIMVLKMLIGHQCTSHIPFRIHYKRLIEYWQSFDQHAPFATKRTNTNISPWLTVGLKNEMDYKDALQRKFRKSKTTENYEKYKRQRNKVNNLVKRAKQNYSKNLQDENSKSTTSFWKTLKHFSPNRNQNLLARHSK